MGLFQRLVQKTGGQAAAPADGAEQVTLSQLIDLMVMCSPPILRYCFKISVSGF